MAETEEKTYLVNVKSNLDKYAKDAAKAADEVDRLTKENKELKDSGKATAAQTEKGNAALRNAKKEYKDATKMVDLQTQANKSNVNSRKQLNAIVTLEQRRLGSLANTYTINEKGVRVLSQSYVDQVQKLKGAKDAVISYDKAQGDGRSSVGLYSEAIENSANKFSSIPGPIGQAGAAIARYSKILLANPIVLIITAIVGAVALLVKGFKNSQPLMDLFDKVSAAIGATFKVLLDRISNFAEFLGGIFSKEMRESRKEAKALNDELIGIEETMTRREKRELRRANKKGLFEEIKEEAAAAYELEQAENALEDSEISFIKRKAELERQIQENINATKDEMLTDKERLKGLDDAIKMQEELTAKEVGFAIERARISQERTDQGNSTRDELRENEELQAAAAAAEAMGLKAQKKILSERFTLINKVNTEEERVAKEQAARDFQMLKDKNMAAVEELRGTLKTQQDIEVQFAEETGADGLEIQKKYADAEEEVVKLTIADKVALYQGAAANLASIFGENTAIGRAAAVAAATISTYQAANLALASYPPPFNFIAAAASIAAGIVNVKKILAVDSGLPGDSGGGSSVPAPTSIAAPSAPRSFASPVESSFFTQPQYSQAELNTTDHGAMLTAEGIASAIGNLPAPIVTVEDINAKAASKLKVEVRANI